MIQHFNTFHVINFRNNMCRVKKIVSFCLFQLSFLASTINNLNHSTIHAECTSEISFMLGKKIKGGLLYSPQFVFP